MFRQLGSIAIALRFIPDRVYSLEELGAPAIARDLALLPRGLVLLTGPTGSGKSTTLTAMVDIINELVPAHIITIEDPIEFHHESKRSLIHQREVGTDTGSFAEALRRVLRQDPDVILIGELRDPESIQTALSAAETGHLVLSTLHTQGAAKSINRIVDVFPADQQQQIRTQLGDTLQGVISQTLHAARADQRPHDRDRGAHQHPRGREHDPRGPGRAALLRDAGGLVGRHAHARSGSAPARRRGHHRAERRDGHSRSTRGASTACTCRHAISMPRRGRTTRANGTRRRPSVACRERRHGTRRHWARTWVSRIRHHRLTPDRED